MCRNLLHQNFENYVSINEAIAQKYPVCTDIIYFEVLANIYITPGVKQAIEEFQCQWLVNAILVAMKHDVPGEINQDWEFCRVGEIGKGLVLNRTNDFVLTCDDGCGNEMYQATFTINDCPYDYAQFYIKDVNLIILPHEYSPK